MSVHLSFLPSIYLGPGSGVLSKGLILGGPGNRPRQGVLSQVPWPGGLGQGSCDSVLYSQDSISNVKNDKIIAVVFMSSLLCKPYLRPVLCV